MVSIVENQQQTLEAIQKDDVKETPPSKKPSSSPPARPIVLGDLVVISDHSRGHDSAEFHRSESDCSFDMKVLKSVTEANYEDLPPLIGGGDTKEAFEEALNQDSATSAETLFLLDVSDGESEGPEADSLLARRSSHRRLGEKGVADNSENRESSEDDSSSSSSDDISSDDDSSDEKEEGKGTSAATVSEEQLHEMAQAFLRSVVQCQAIFRRYRAKQLYRKTLDALQVLQLWARPIAQKVRRKRRRGERQAAIRIQTTVRGFMARLAFDELLEYLEEQLSALVIQSWWREVSIGSPAEHEAATRIQAAFRGWAATEFYMLQGFAVSLIQSQVRGHRMRQNYKHRKAKELKELKTGTPPLWVPSDEDEALSDSVDIPCAEESTSPRESRGVVSPVDTIASSTDSYSNEVPPTETSEIDGRVGKASLLYPSSQSIGQSSSDDSLPPSPTRTEVDTADYNEDEEVDEKGEGDQTAHASFTTVAFLAIFCLALPILLSVDGFTDKFAVPSVTYEPFVRTFSNLVSSFTPPATPERIHEPDKKHANTPVPAVQQTPRVEPSIPKMDKPSGTTERKRMQRPPQTMETAPTTSFHVPSSGLFFGEKIGEREKVLSKAVSRADKSPVFNWANQLRALVFQTTTNFAPTKLEVTGWLQSDGRGLFASRLNAENLHRKVKKLTRSKTPLVEESSLKVAKDANLSLLKEWGLVLIPRQKPKSS
jgi:hypothetical protein